MSRSDLKLGHVGSKTRSLGQILENLVYTLKGTVLIEKFMKLCQIVYHHNIQVSFETVSC